MLVELLPGLDQLARIRGGRVPQKKKKNVAPRRVELTDEELVAKGERWLGAHHLLALEALVNLRTEWKPCPAAKVPDLPPEERARDAAYAEKESKLMARIATLAKARDRARTMNEERARVGRQKVIDALDRGEDPTAAAVESVRPEARAEMRARIQSRVAALHAAHEDKRRQAELEITRAEKEQLRRTVREARGMRTLAEEMLAEWRAKGHPPEVLALADEQVKKITGLLAGNLGKLEEVEAEEREQETAVGYGRRRAWTTGRLGCS